MEGGSDGRRADVGVIRVGINVVRAFGEAERAGDDQRLGGDGAARVGLVGNLGNGGIDFLHDDSAVAVLNDGEVVALAGGYVGFCLAVHVLIHHVAEVRDARCVNLVDAVADGHGADCNSRTRISISLADTVSRIAAGCRHGAALDGDGAELY